MGLKGVITSNLLLIFLFFRIAKAQRAIAVFPSPGSKRRPPQPCDISNFTASFWYCRAGQNCFCGFEAVTDPNFDTKSSDSSMYVLLKLRGHFPHALKFYENCTSGGEKLHIRPSSSTLHINL